MTLTGNRVVRPETGGPSRAAATLRRRSLLIVLLVGVSLARAGAVNPSLSQADTQRALRLGAAAQAVRARFHAPYLVTVRDSLIREVQVLTEFRRTVIAAEDALKRGDWTVAQGARGLDGHSIEDTVRPWRRKVTLVATLQLDALHAYVTVPNCEVMMGGMPVLASLDRRTTPLSSLPYSSRGAMTTSLVGALIEADFDAEAVGQTSRDAVVLCDGRDVARATIDFSRLE
jgi:hypothetical protein